MEAFTPQSARELIGSDCAQILEIGANDGEDTAAFLTAFPHPDTRIHSFECDPRACQRWCDRIHDERATLWPFALADRKDWLPFHPSDGDAPGWDDYGPWDKSGSLLAPDKHTSYDPWLRFQPAVTVETHRLDDLWPADLRVFDLAWVDVQGAEAIVLRGGQQTIRRIRWWYCECHQRPYYHGQASLPELCDLLPGFEFVRGYPGDNFLWRNTTL